MNPFPKVLIIRFSSLGDILMCMSVINGFKNKFPNSQIHWIIRSDFASVLSVEKRINKIWALDRETGLKGLIHISKSLKEEKFDYIYDAHSNLRSFILKFFLHNIWHKVFNKKPLLVRKKKEYFKRFLLFNFHINLFPKPYKGMVEFQRPLLKWGISNFDYHKINWSFSKEIQSKANLILKDLKLNNKQKWITIVPSAAWEIKRWPITHWKRLIKLLPQFSFVILGGPKDNFCDELVAVSPDKVFNLAGKTSLLVSLFIIKNSSLVISADTGLIHAADIFHTKGIVLRGPTAFGAPTGKHITTLETKLFCRPCTKHGNTKCKLKTYQKCMVDIHPKQVAKKILMY